MSRARALAALDRRILLAFSHRTIAALRAAVPVRAALPRLEQILSLNVAKEACKDAIVIECGAHTPAVQLPPARDVVLALLEQTKRIDREFLDRVGSFPLGIVIRYEEIAPIRLQRIERLLIVSARICDAWREADGMRAAMRRAYDAVTLERELTDILRLYALETTALSRSVHLPALLAPLRDRLARSVNSIMNDAAVRLTRDLIRVTYRRASREGAAMRGR